MHTSYWNAASDALKKNAKAMRFDQEFTIRQIVGEVLWSPLQRTTRHRLGKHVRANLADYGLSFVRKAGSVAVYTRSGV